MNVQRLRLGIARAARAVVRVWRQYAMQASVPHPRVTYSWRSPGSDLATARWLDDCRRLHARVGARPRPTLMYVSHEQLRQIFTDPRWASAYDATPPPRPARPPQVSEGHAPQPTAESMDSRPVAPSSPAAASDEHADRELRRLVFIRDLVRRGIYNEGFDPAHLPEQYRPPADDPAL